MRAQATAAVRFGILGPLSASLDGEALSLGGARQRTLLAVLLVHANELVSTERLIEQLFDGSRSASSVNAVHVAVSRLRRTLRDERAELLRTRKGGYVLELEAEQLDAATFERLLDDGRSLLASGDHAGASERLREGLALWRGPPLADLGAVEDVQPEVRRLEELRLLAEMERVDAELALGRAAEVVAPLESLIQQAPLQERLRAQLMLALYRSGRQAEALAAYREACALLREELGLTPGAELRELEQMILRHDAGLEAERSGSPPPGAVVCPFKGLAAFEGSDADFFCGRERVVSELIARLAEWPLVGILGPSGIGKSSLLRAGVLPALRAGALPGSAGWRQVMLRPGEHPCAELERALGGPVDKVLANLGVQERIVVAIDQLEELFTACQQEPERREFLARLVAAAGEDQRRVLVLCTLRADFYGRLSAYPGFAELLSRSHALVGPMDPAELREAIERPAARAGLEVEDRLVDVLVAEVGDEPGALPLLSTTLLELWRARDGHVLRLQDYRATGGVRSGVARIAEAAYMRLPEAEQRVAREVLLRLADVDDGAPERRRAPLVEIEAIAGVQPVLGALTDARLVTVGPGAVELSHEALLREWPRYRGWLEEDRVGRRLHAHLRVAASEWDARGRDAGDLYRGTRLAAALEFCTQRPDQMDRLEGEFVAASRAAAEGEAARQRIQNRRLRALLFGAGVLLVLAVVAGVVAVVGQQQASSDARLAVAEARSALGRQLGAEALGAPRLDVAALLAREAVTLDRSPQTEGTLLTTLLRSPAVVATFSLPTNSTPQVAVSPDGDTLAVSDSVSDSVRFYDSRTRALGGQLSDFFGDQPPVYSGNGSLLVYRTGPALAVRDARTLALRARLPIGAPFTQELTADVAQGSILISPNGHTVYYAYWQMTAGGQPAAAHLARWALPGGRRLATVALGHGPLLALRLLDEGRRLVVVTGRAIRTYDASTLAPLRSVAIRPAPLLPTAAAVSPDGATVAIGSQSGAVSFVDAATGEARHGHGGHGATVASVLFAPDGRTAITVGDDGKVIVWDPDALEALKVLPGVPERVQDARLGPDGATLYTSAVGGVLLAWDLTGQRGFGHSARVGATRPCCDPISPLQPALALSPDGARFAVATGPSAVGVFSTRTLRLEASFTIKPAGDAITALAWSPSGAGLAVGGHGGVVQLWNVDSAPRYVRSFTDLTPLAEQTEAIQALAFSPDGTLLAASDKSQTTSLGHTSAALVATMAVWRVASGGTVAPVTELGGGNSLNGSDVVAFSPDGKRLAATLLTGGVRIYDPLGGQLLGTLSDPGDDGVSLAFGPKGILAEGTIGGTVELWRPATGRRVVASPLLADSVAITSVAFDPTGRRFATAGSGDGTIKVWFTAGLQQEAKLASGPDATSAAAFEPGGRALLVVDDHGGAFAWPTSLTAWQQDACALAGRNLTRAEWTQFVAGPRYTSVCP
ncbi:MAG TPA: BTAD domain-containing putative transcriptional regulator [Solirubrobacteraceae bacterium]|nr:BTAD domain-containing putative transcriptional regulator [Solirubrobacteraceae bacterium]